MKQTIYILTFTLLLLSCSSQTSKTVDKVSIDTLQSISEDKIQSDIYVKDKSQYDQFFIEGLSGYNEPIRLIDNYIITGKDTTYFPEIFPLDKAIVFKGTKNENNFLLSVTRKNLTNLAYDFKFTDKDDKIIYSKLGKSVLGSSFYLGSEIDEDSQKGESYESYEYWDKTSNCWFAIRIGDDKDTNGKHRAKVTYGCEDKNEQSLKLEDCPTLRTE